MGRASRSRAALLCVAALACCWGAASAAAAAAAAVPADRAAAGEPPAPPRHLAEQPPGAGRGAALQLAEQPPPAGVAVLSHRQRRPAAADFGAQIAREASVLDEAHGPEQEMKEMESLLHWAIEHSDPDKLRERAEEVQKDEAVRDFLERRQRVAELSELMSHQPTETQLIVGSIAVLTDERASTSDKAAALAELQVLVEPVDNANDLKVLGGLPPLVALLGPSAPPELQEGAAYVLGTAASNNAKLVGLLLAEHAGVLQLLLEIAGSPAEGAAAKAMYALGVLVRSHAPEARARFFGHGGLSQLQALMAPASRAPRRVKTKAVNLLSDLIEMTATGDDVNLDTWDDAVMAQFAAGALGLLMQAEPGPEGLHDKERALLAMRTLLTRRGNAGRLALEDEGAEPVLREALTELDLEVEALGGFGGADAEQGGSEAAAGGGQQGGPGSAGGDAEEGDREQWSHAIYVSHLCADVLHHLSIHHEEL